MLIILFRSKLTAMTGDDYAATNAELEQHVKANPGFVEVKGFTAADNERLTVVWWRDRESLDIWREDLKHMKAKQAGRTHWYEYYKMEVAEVFRQSVFEHEKGR